MLDMLGPLQELPRGHFGAILADPPWAYDVWKATEKPRHQGNLYGIAERHYETLSIRDLALLPIGELAAPDCVLFCWVTWPCLRQSFHVLDAWGFEYKTCAFAWMKADASQTDMFPDDIPVWPGLGHWTRANSEVCLLATRGSPKRLNAGVRQGIIAPRREHSRKPDGIHERIERLVAGPYLELFARQSSRPGWSFWGNQIEMFT
jgi:N6-adenosine-specific RNA methylase IME4